MAYTADFDYNMGLGAVCAKSALFVKDLRKMIVSCKMLNKVMQ